MFEYEKRKREYLKNRIIDKIKLQNVHKIKIKIIQKTYGWRAYIDKITVHELLLNTLETAVALNHRQCHNTIANE